MQSNKPIRVFTRREVRTVGINGKVKAAIEMRRSGKTSFLYQCLKDKLDSGQEKETLPKQFPDFNTGNIDGKAWNFSLINTSMYHDNLKFMFKKKLANLSKSETFLWGPGKRVKLLLRNTYFQSTLDQLVKSWLAAISFRIFRLFGGQRSVVAAEVW